MKVYYKLISKNDVHLANTTTEKMCLINIEDIDDNICLEECIELLDANKSLLKIAIDKQTNCVYMISFDNTFNITSLELKHLQENGFENVIIILDGDVEVTEIDYIIKCKNDNSYIYVDNDARYVIKYIIYNDEKLEEDELEQELELELELEEELEEELEHNDKKIRSSDWFMKNENENDNNFVHVLTIYHNYKCDEDEGIYYNNAGEKFIDIMYCALSYALDNFGDEWCHMNTSKYD